jgi:ribosomal protein L11 methyltransferase
VSWIEVKASFDQAPEDWSPLIDLFVRHGCDNTLQTDLPATILACVVEVPGAREEIDALSLELRAAGAREVLVGPYEEQDWEEAWKKFFKPRRVGKSFVVRPTWEEFEALPGDHVIVLDPGQAFGTGDHPTTRMCLALLEEADIPGSDVLDLGCGSGILSIGAAMLGAKSVFAIDVDPLAVEVTRENARLNEITLEVAVSDGMIDHQPQTTNHKPRTYDVVLSNIISAALIRFAGDISRVVKPGGRWMVSGILNPNWLDVEKAAERVGFRLDKKVEEDDWVAAIFLR